jgi:hypothetical protein
MISTTAFLTALLLATPAMMAQEVDESALFADTATVTQAPLAATDSALQAPRKTTGSSGDLTVMGYVVAPRDDMGNPDLVSSVVGDLFLDARLLQGIKGYAALEASYDATHDTTQIHLREMFMDMNIHERVYFRIGKQVLQWGRCNLWNPVDLINVERKRFVQRIGSREGVFGLKAHIPFGTAVNLYGFMDTRNASAPESLSTAGKVELIVKGTEMAFSAWGKRGKIPVFGYDISSRLAGIDIAGEAAAFRRDNENRLGQIGDSLFLQKGPQLWTPRIALNLSHSFDVNGIPDRLLVSVEGYYNGTGTDSKMFEDTLKYKSDVPGMPPESYVINGMPITVQQPAPAMKKLEYFLANGLYRPNEHSFYYAALFTSFSRFINSNMALSFNAIGNIGERCATLMGGLSYRDLRDLSLGLTVLGYVGPKKREYTMGYRFSKEGIEYFTRGLDVQLTAGISF